MADVKRTLLLGTLAEGHPLSLLRGHALVWHKVFGFVDDWYEAHINLESGGYLSTPYYFNHNCFPEPTGLQINMMPVRLDQESTWPPFCDGYARMMQQCNWNRSGRALEEEGHNVAYLTICETMVPVGTSQRRGGLHIESPSALLSCGQITKEDMRECEERQCLAWGHGKLGPVPVDGCFMASNVSRSCAVWDAVIINPEDVTDRHGGLPEHMRRFLGEPKMLGMGELCWFTDRTPHESLPLCAPPDNPGAKVVQRSFFRLVVGKLSVWYSKHNTPNPMGLLPDCPISHADKFADC